MNPAQGQAPQQAPAQGQPGAANQQPRPPPMYQPNQIRNLPMLSEEEKNKYEQGLKGLWNKANTSPANSPEQIAARQKIIEFSKMLVNKIQVRRSQAQQQQQAQQGQPGGQPARPSSGQSNPSGQAAGTPTTTQQKPQQAPATSQGSQGQAAPASAAGPTQNQNPQPGTAVAAGPATTATTATATTAPRLKIPDHVLQHVNKITWRPPPQFAGKPAAEITKWIEDMKDKYARAILTMDGSKAKVAGMEKLFKERSDAGRPLQDEELRQYQIRRDTQLKYYQDAHKWVENARRQQELFANHQQAGAQASQNGTAPATSGSQQNNTQATPSAAENNAQAATQNVTASVNAAVEAAKTQQNRAAANRPPPANGTPTPTPTPAQSQPRPVPQPVQQPQGQAQAKTEQPHPPPVNTAQAQAAAQGQATARVQTPQSATPATAGGPTRALSHSAAMNLANQRAASTPSTTPAQSQAATSGAGGVGGAVNQGAVVPGAVQQQQSQQQQQQQGHPHAHPTQTQTGFQAKMPIPKQLPEKATAVPQGVTVGGGVSAGRPTMSQGSGTLGGVMNQPPVARIPAYSHDAEGDHVLSKKKLDELVRQVCGGSGDSQDGNLLTPEVEESILSMADSFVDTVLHSACRNAKERGSKVLEIRDIQLVLERAYNIRVPGYSSDELRTVRKVQPSPGWIAKMSAVQAAKVMPGKGEP
ncbi:Transcription initiation factor TFIID subunit 12 [Metarhizium acridum]|nr:Transcription initiation factor TFIID subunit 12 [Metarhizium acridum]